MARAFGSYPKCQQFKSVRRYQEKPDAVSGFCCMYRRGAEKAVDFLPATWYTIQVAGRGIGVEPKGLHAERCPSGLWSWS